MESFPQMPAAAVLILQKSSCAAVLSYDTMNLYAVKQQKQKK